ncbi:MAG: hypothetical protein UZ11_BCD004000157 [Bacteroidetes bacterium OLB11]|nr:MAG: hypothetical protein UZ11_BCD004000157 [Bacteroidetes bacterium OLB11]
MFSSFDPNTELQRHFNYFEEVKICVIQLFGIYDYEYHFKHFFFPKTLGILGCAIATISSVYILSFMQLHLTIKSLKVTYNQYIDFKSLFKILVITLVAICIIRMGLDLITLPAIPMFLLGGILTLPLLYFYFIKSKFIDIQLYENLFNKIPIFGKHLYKILQ